MARGRLITHSQLANYLNKKVDILKRCGDDPRAQLGESNYNGVVSPLIILGAPGIGKTVGMRALAKQLGIGYVEFRLNEINQLDLAGLPYVERTSEGEAMTAYAATKALPRWVAKRKEYEEKVNSEGNLYALGQDAEGNSRHSSAVSQEIGLLVFDEITSASEGCRSVALRLLDSSRAVGTDYKLPDKWICVAMGNDAEDGGANYTGLEAAFLSRCAVFRLAPNAPDWLQWAETVGIHPAVMAYIKQNKDMIYVPPNDDGDEPMIGASPRIWENTSANLAQAEGTYFGDPPVVVTDDLELLSALGFLRDDVADKFSAFYRLQAKMIPIETILNGTSRKLTREDGTHDATFLAFEFCFKALKDKYTGTLLAGSAAAVTEVMNVVNWCMDLRSVGGSEVCAQAFDSLFKWPPLLKYAQTPNFVKNHAAVFKEMTAVNSALKVAVTTKKA